MGTPLAAAGFGLMLLVTMAAIWLSFPDEVRESFTPFQRITVGVVVLGLAVAGHALARSRVDAGEEGLTVVNGYRVHRLDWAQVLRVTLRPGSPWAVLDLSDGTTRSAMGIQASDGARARRQARDLASLVAAHSAVDPSARREGGGHGEHGEHGERGE